MADDRFSQPTNRHKVILSSTDLIPARTVALLNDIARVSRAYYHPLAREAARIAEAYGLRRDPFPPARRLPFCASR